ncbi:MAG: hypothetical protein ACFFAS_02900 [Promethearchaeota archaeon]
MTTVENESFEHPHFKVEKEKKEKDQKPHIKITWDNQSNDPNIPHIRVMWDNDNPKKVKIEIDGKENDLSDIHND